MKGQDPLRRGQREICSIRTCLALCQVLHALQIREASLQKSQASGQDRLALWPLQQVEEGDPRKKLGVITCEPCGKLAQGGMQQFDPALGQLVEMPIGFALLGDDLPGDGSALFKVLESQIERLVVQDNHPTKRPVDILFDLVAVDLAAAWQELRSHYTYDTNLYDTVIYLEQRIPEKGENVKGIC